jgi:octanoyl-[GcvH]:protein N-octanoyltransferase
MAVSHALLRRVAGGHDDATLRLFAPAPTVAFGRADAHLPGFAAACTAARDHGFAPLIRLGGGHAAAYDERSLLYELIVPHTRLLSGVHERFAAQAARLASALQALGVDARVGELPGEYCPGAYSINAGAAIKLGGLSQRAIKGAVLLSAVIVVGSQLRALISDVYGALDLPLDPATVGAVQDVAPGVTVDDVGRSIAATYDGLVPRALDPATRDLATQLEGQHLPG